MIIRIFFSILTVLAPVILVFIVGEPSHHQIAPAITSIDGGDSPDSAE